MYLLRLIFLLKLFSCQTTVKASESDFKIENLPGGLYFFDIGSAHISTGNYELHHFYNISELLYEKNFLTNLRNEIQELTQNDALLIINLIITC